MSKNGSHKRKQSRFNTIKLRFAPQEQVTAFGGVALTEKLARRAGFWSALDKVMPTRRGYDWTTIVKSIAAGLMTGPRGMFAAEDIRQDPVLSRLLGFEEDGIPEEATVCRALAQLGNDPVALGALEHETRVAARRLLQELPHKSLGPEGFVSVFVDGTLLEGSPQREGTKNIPDKGKGLLWTVSFVGPVPVCARLSPKGEGEQTAALALLGKTCTDVLEPAGLRDRSLVLMDSLHGKGPMLDQLEDLSLRYVVGARGLVLAERVVASQPASQWRATPEFDRRGRVENAAVCVASLQIEGWRTARTLVARRWRKPGDMFDFYTCVLTNLTPDDPTLRALMERKKWSFAEAVLFLYDQKGACETYFKGMLSDLGLHHPPSQSWASNAAFYAIGLVAGMLGVVTALLDPESRGRGVATIATVRRRLWAVSVRLVRHARETVVEVLGLSEKWRQQIEGVWSRMARC